MGLFGNKKPFLAQCRALDPEVLAAYGGKPGGQRTEDMGPMAAEPRLPPRASAGNRIAIFGDVHANLEALEAVLADAGRQGVARFACTGDLVGYGPDPSECLELVKGLGCPLVKGNHDDYAATDTSLEDFTLNAMNALLWTREQLAPEERAWLDGLPMEMDVDAAACRVATAGNEVNGNYAKATKTDHGGAQALRPDAEGAVPPNNHQPSTTNSCHMVHSSVFEPEAWRYVIKPEEAEKVLPMQRPALVFFGHTHIPAVYAFHPATGAMKATVPSAEGRTVLEEGWKWLVNPGSVGQPRDRDPRAAYLVYDAGTRTIEHRRVPYDFSQTARKIIAAGLPERNAGRLGKGR